MIERFWVMSIQAAVLIAAVLLIRQLLKRCSKVYGYCLWMLVLLRLLCPVFIESKVSLQPDFNSVENLLPGEGAILQLPPALPNTEGNGTDPQTKDILISEEFEENQDRAVPDRFSFFAGYFFNTWTPLRGLRLMWAAGVIVLICWFFVQYLQIRRRVFPAVREEGNVFRCERIAAPFVMGVIRPKIYLPYGVDGEELRYILAHERVHIRHGDPVVRMAAIFAICLHWWNPLVWYGMYKMTQDMEMFCDETVLAGADQKDRKAYSTALLHAAMKQSGFSVVLPFGETKTELRIRNILKRKKKGILITLLAAGLFVGCAAVFLTVPFAAKAEGSPEETVKAMQQNLLDHQEEIEALSKKAEEEKAELAQQPVESVQHREGFEEPRLTYEETPYSMTENEISDREERLAVRALQDLYDLTGTQIEACFYTCCDNLFFFGMEKGDITHSRDFYHRAFGAEEGYPELFISSMGMTNARRVWYSPVQQYDIPVGMEKMSTEEQAVWFLERSAVFRGGSITGTGPAYEQDPELLRVFIEDGTFYEVQLDTAIQAVASIYGPYPEGFEH